MKNERKLIRRSVLSFGLALIAATTCFFAGCGTDGKDGKDGVSVSSIEKTATNGLVDTYTIYYTDGSTDTFEVTNGKDADVGAAYDRYVEEYGEIGYADFLSLYMNFEEDGYTVVNRCLQTSAKVYSEFTQSGVAQLPYPPFYTTVQQTAVYTGASVVYRIDQDYTYFVTNYHVVYNANAVDEKISQKINLYLYGSESSPVEAQDENGNSYFDYGEYAIECQYVGGSVAYDLAVLKAETEKVKAINPHVQAVELADGYRVGQTAITIGNPDDEGLSVTKGVVSVDNDYITLNIDGTTRSYRSIRIDTPLYSGNSGGGLFDGSGKLIGIANAGNGTEENINYAIPLPVVKGVVENVLFYHFDENAATSGAYALSFGVEVSSKNARYVYDDSVGYGAITEDILIESLVEGGIAEELGLSVGDKLLSIEYAPTGSWDWTEKISLNRSFDLGDAALYLTKGTAFRFTYERNGEEGQTKIYTVSDGDLTSVS